MKSSAILFTGVLAITGCGGSGGDDNKGATKPVSTPVVTPYSFVLSDSNLMSDESQTSVITISEQGASSSTYEIQSDNDLVSGNVSGNQLSIIIGEFDRDTQITLTIVGTQGGASQSKTLMLDVTNASVAPLLEKIDLLVSAQEKLVSFDDESVLFEFMSNMAFRSGSISQSQRAKQQAEYTSVVSGVTVAFNESLQSLNGNLEQYKNSELSESELEASYLLALSALNEHGLAALEAINLLMGTMPSLTLLPLNGFSYVEQISDFSQLIGQLDLGHFENEEWFFTNEFEFLNELLPSMSATNQSCSIVE